MRATRSTCLAIGALFLAVLPGLTQLTTTRPLHRVEASAPGLLVAPAAETPPNPPTSAEAAAPLVPPEPPPTPDVVAIVPPTEPMTGELAPIEPPTQVALAEARPFAFAAAKPSTRGEVLALVIGIDDYPGSRYDLDAAVADADTIDAALARFGVPAENRVVLRNGQARRAELVAAISSLVERAVPGTKVVLAFAGHVQKLGAHREAFIAADGGLLTDEELAVLLGPASSDRMWLLFATCYGGGFTEALGPGRVLTAAADANSLAYESKSINGSYLVHHMVREGWLDGRAGPSVQEAFAFASARMAEKGRRMRPVQIDREGTPLRLDDQSTGGTSGAPAPNRDHRSSPPPASSSPTTTVPPRRCTLLVLCSRT